MSAARTLFAAIWLGEPHALRVDPGVSGSVAVPAPGRRVHYTDLLDPVSMTLTYVGEGLNGDQSLTRGNKALVDAAESGNPVEVFFDCGDIQLPHGGAKKFEKHFLAGGKWRVVAHDFRHVPDERRMVWIFRLVPIDEHTRRTLQTIFLDAATGSGHRFAVKTVTSERQKTSNIWTALEDLPRTIDGFLVLDLDPLALEPRALFKLPISRVERFWSPDTYQGAGKLMIDERFRDVAEQVA